MRAKEIIDIAFERAVRCAARGDTPSRITYNDLSIIRDELAAAERLAAAVDLAVAAWTNESVTEADANTCMALLSTQAAALREQIDKKQNKEQDDDE